MSKTPEKFALEDLTDEQKFDSYDGCPRCDEQLLIALDGYQDSRVWGTGGLVAATARAAKQAAYFAEKVATLETQRDEARAEVERLRKALRRLAGIASGGFISHSFVERVAAEACGDPDPYPAFAEKLAEMAANKPTQPEIFEAHGREWYRHDGGPCPCDLEMKICVCLDNDSCTYTGVKAKRWDWRPCNSGKILGWRPADSPEKLPRK